MSHNGYIYLNILSNQKNNKTRQFFEYHLCVCVCEPVSGMGNMTKLWGGEVPSLGQGLMLLFVPLVPQEH